MNQTKLTNPLARSRNAGIHNSIVGSVNGIERINRTEAPKSMILRTSPVNINKLFKKIRPAQKRVN